jgi:hypothetical protein
LYQTIYSTPCQCSPAKLVLIIQKRVRLDFLETGKGKVGLPTSD